MVMSRGWDVVVLVLVLATLVPASHAVAAPRALLVVMDGLRGDHAFTADTPTLNVLREVGAWTDEAATIVPSLTLPSHATLLTGQGVERTGVRWNYHAEGRGRHCLVPNVFGILGGQGQRSAAFFNKKKLILLMDPTSMDALDVCGWNPVVAAGHAAAFIRGGGAPFVFVHLAEPDSAGHRDGWGSAGYREGVRRADACLATLMQALLDGGATGETLVVVTSDHGGRDRTHGGSSPEELKVPLVLAGTMVRAGRLPAGVATRDIVPTILRAMGSTGVEGCEGRVLTEALAGSPGVTP